MHTYACCFYVAQAFCINCLPFYTSTAWCSESVLSPCNSYIGCPMNQDSTAGVTMATTATTILTSSTVVPTVVATVNWEEEW